MPAGLVEGGAELLGELPPGPVLPGVPLIMAPLTGLVVVEEIGPGVEVSLEFAPDGMPPGLVPAALVRVVPPGDPVAGRVVGEAVLGLVAPGELPAGLLLPGELVPFGDVVPEVGVPPGELPPELPGTEPTDEVVPGLELLAGLDVPAGLDDPKGALVLGLLLPGLASPGGEAPGLPVLVLTGDDVEGGEPGDELPGLVPGGLAAGVPVLGVPAPGVPAPGVPAPGVLVPGVLVPGLPEPGEVPPVLPGLPLPGAEVDGEEPGELLPGSPGEPPVGLLVVVEVGAEVGGVPPELDAPANTAPGGAVVKVAAPVATTPLLLLTV
jgi:putative serine protease PepD